MNNPAPVWPCLLRPTPLGSSLTPKFVTFLKILLVTNNGTPTPSSWNPERTCFGSHNWTQLFQAQLDPGLGCSHCSLSLSPFSAPSPRPPCSFCSPSPPPLGRPCPQAATFWRGQDGYQLSKPSPKRSLLSPSHLPKSGARLSTAPNGVWAIFGPASVPPKAKAWATGPLWGWPVGTCILWPQEQGRSSPPSPKEDLRSCSQKPDLAAGQAQATGVHSSKVFS